jgi:predicted regulator of Ras-like GTPase activity (Roadblock/LC7/MglB family)
MRKLCFIAILALAGCQSQQVVDFDTALLPTRGPVAIDVQSFAGNVTIIADPSIVGTQVQATQLELGLDEVPERSVHMTCSTTIETGITGEIVHVVATCDDNALGLISAEIVIRANSIHGVSVTTSNGNVTLLGISGAVDVTTRDGNVRIVTPLVMNERVSVENRRGDIVYRVRGESSGIIDATAMNGEVALDLRQGKAIILPGSTGDHLVATFNGGTNPIIMRTVDGDVRLYVVADPIGSEPLFNTDWFTW